MFNILLFRTFLFPVFIYICFPSPFLNILAKPLSTLQNSPSCRVSMCKSIPLPPLTGSSVSLLQGTQKESEGNLILPQDIRSPHLVYRVSFFVFIRHLLSTQKVCGPPKCLGSPRPFLRSLQIKISCFCTPEEFSSCTQVAIHCYRSPFPCFWLVPMHCPVGDILP